jgi:hypothetical protein
MSSTLLGFAAHVVYAWTRLYTWRLPPGVRDDRQREIVSDLWESREDTDGRRSVLLALHMLGRMLAGMPDDVLWRWEHARQRQRSLRPRAAIALIASVVFLIVAALWVVDLAQVDLPDPPVMVKAIASPRPPPPPPPPPPRHWARR